MNKPSLPTRNSNSHKGEVGKVLIVGGNYKYYGAPIFAGMAAERSGADLVSLFLPAKHVETAKKYSLNFFLHQFVQADLGLKDMGLILDESTRADAILLGNGAGTDNDTRRAILKMLEEFKIPMVLDAEAIFADILKIKRRAPLVVTPHKGEFERLFDVEPTQESVAKMSKEHDVTILLKSPHDIIGHGGEVSINKTGCAQMRVGGTGDALAGIVVSFLSQGMSAFEACESAAYFWGKAGEALSAKKRFFTTEDLIRFFPKFLASQ